MENTIIDNLLDPKDKTYLELIAQSDNKENIAKIVTAFINAQGGDVILGIDANKSIIGIDDAEDEIKKIHEYLIKHIKPTIPIFSNVVICDKKSVILIHVWKGSRKPYQYQRVFYSRKNENIDIASIEDIKSMIERRENANPYWEQHTIIGAELEDLDAEEIRKTCEAYRKYKGEIKSINNEEFLMQAGLMKEGNLTNACILLFGKHPTHFIPQSRIRLTIYSSQDSESQFIDDKYFKGNIFKNIVDIFNYLDLEKIERYNYPRTALREGILNAIIHRNYYHTKSFLQISIFSDRIEISNYGNLPDGRITIDDLIRHRSILQNPDIACICFLRKYAELLGSGTLRMIEDCKENNYEKPMWKNVTNIVKVIFRGVSHHKIIEGMTERVTRDPVEGIINDATEGVVDDAIKGVTNEANEGVINNIIEGVANDVAKGVISNTKEGVIGDIIEGVTDGIAEGAKDKQKQILSTIHQKPGIRVPEIEKFTNIPAKTIETYIKQLRESKLIEFKGSFKTGGYYSTKNN